MIRFLQGTVHSHEDRTIILLTNGVGYQVFVPDSVLAEEDEEISLYIHTHVREDDIKLFGFRTKNELKFFELLLGVNGVGPKMAVEILNQPTDQIKAAIFNGDLTILTRIPGVGKKIAERMCLELRNKIEPVENQEYSPASQREVNEDVIITLETLGYKRSHINKVLSSIKEDVSETEDLIRIFLQRV